MQNSLFHPRPAWLPDAAKAIAKHECLTAKQLAALLCADPVEVGRALDALVREGLLESHCPHHGFEEGAPSVAFTLTRLGARELARVIEQDLRGGVRLRRSPLTLAHDLERNDLGIVLELLDRQGSLRLLRWETTRSRLAEVAHLRVRGEQLRIPLVADGLAVLSVGGRRTALLVEIDRGTVSTTRMEEKFRGYHAWWREGGPARRFGVESLRVLTIVPHVRRLRQLHTAALDATLGRGSGLFWFAVAGVVDLDTPEKILGAVWTVAREDPRPEFLFGANVNQTLAAEG